MKYLNLVFSLLVSFNIYCAVDEDRASENDYEICMSYFKRLLNNNKENEAERIGHFLSKFQNGAVPIEVIITLVSQAENDSEWATMIELLSNISHVTNYLINSNLELLLERYLLASNNEKNIEQFIFEMFYDEKQKPLNDTYGGIKFVIENIERKFKKLFIYSKLITGDIIVNIASKALNVYELEKFMQVLCRLSPNIKKLIYSSYMVILPIYFEKLPPEYSNNLEFKYMVNNLFLEFTCKYSILYRTSYEESAIREYKLLPKLLLLAGADINMQDAETGKTALINVVERDKKDVECILRFLIAEGADLNIQDNNGNTALINACWSRMFKGIDRSFDIIILLVNAGADVNIKNNHGYTLLDTIISQIHAFRWISGIYIKSIIWGRGINEDAITLKMVEFLLSSGAKVSIATFLNADMSVKKLIWRYKSSLL